MSEIRTCIFCKKQLLDEKISVCKRCRTKGGQIVVGTLSGIILAGLAVLKFTSDDNLSVESNDSEKEEGENEDDE